MYGEYEIYEVYEVYEVCDRALAIREHTICVVPGCELLSGSV